MTFHEATERDEYCSVSKRVDGKKHSWKWDGDDPNIICWYCGQVRRNGFIIVQGRSVQPEEPDNARPSTTVEKQTDRRSA